MKDEFRKLKIIYHHRTQGRGAEGVHIREIIKSLEKLGHQVYVVNPPGIDVLSEKDKTYPSGERSALAKFWSFLSKYTPEIFFEILELCYNIVAFKAIKNVIQKENIDFIYERNAFFCFAGTAVARKFGIPIFIEVNEVSGIERIRGQVLTATAKKIEKFNFRHAYAIIVVSNFLKKHIESFEVEKEKVHVMPNAVDIEKFQLHKIDAVSIIKGVELKNKLVLGFVGSFIKWHNFDFLFDAYNDLVKGTEQDTVLLLLGDGPLRQELELKAKNLGLESKIIFAGSVSHNKVPGYIKAMDVCIIPHANEYRSPIKLFEYMAMAKPVVAPGVEPIKSIIKHSENGWLFDIENKESLLNELNFLIKNKNIREKIGETARNSVVNAYLWSHNAQKLLQIYYEKKLDSYAF